MTAWYIFSFASIVAALIAYTGLVLWAWRTPNGWGWRVFSVLATADLARTVVWITLILQEPARYAAPQPLIRLVLLLQIVSTICTCALALALRRGMRRAPP